MKNSQKGFSLVESVIALSIALFGFYALSYMVENSTTRQSQMAVRDSTEIVKTTIYSMIQNPSSWNSTSSKTDFDCVMSDTCGSSVDFDLYGSAGTTAYYPAKNKKAGFTKSGLVCDTYPSGACPIRLDLTFKSLCTSCTQKQISINAVFTNFNHTSNKFAFQNTGFEMIKNMGPPPPPPGPCGGRPLVASCSIGPITSQSGSTGDLIVDLHPVNSYAECDTKAKAWAETNMNPGDTYGLHGDLRSGRRACRMYPSTGRGGCDGCYRFESCSVQCS